MKKYIFLISGFVLVAILTSLILIYFLNPARKFKDVDQIVIILRYIDDTPGSSLVINATDLKQFSKLLDTITLKPKKRCHCGHTYELVFRKNNSDTRVEICDHCFDIVKGVSGRKCYCMDPRFYKTFQEIISKYPQVPKEHLLPGMSDEEIKQLESKNMLDKYWFVILLYTLSITAIIVVSILIWAAWRRKNRKGDIGKIIK